MDVELGTAQDKALVVWGTIYTAASGVLHGRRTAMEDAVALYTDVLAAAGQVLVPLPGRAARVLEPAALEVPPARRGEGARRVGGPARHRLLLPLPPGPGMARRPRRAHPCTC
ncbi:hypothetical protein ABZ599_37430 [Streptomyces misionensis]|uniref:hypothetical protein n=1 Tax=Streptomyces misionensis TaxID=67331 RepID=UPI0033BFFB6C